MTRFKLKILLAIFVALMLILLGVGWANSQGLKSFTGIFNPIVLIGIPLMWVTAKIGGHLAIRIKQPAVLGELLGGMLLGNIQLAGVNRFQPLVFDSTINLLAELGVILLLFEIGLRTNIVDMKGVGWSSLLVALVGVVMPLLLGSAVAAYFIPENSRLAHLFVGSVLCATSVGITARVLKDLRQLSARESKIILGAAVIDDVIGLLILAIILRAIRAANAGSTISISDLAWLAVKCLAFLVGGFLLAQRVTKSLFRGAGRFATAGTLIIVSIAFCLLVSWIAGRAGLAPIVGSFGAGLMLEEFHFKPFRDRGVRDLVDLLSPITTTLVPIFFVLMGMKVQLNLFVNSQILGLTVVLTLVAIVGKQLCGFAAIGAHLNRLAIGIGMIPRGEVGLIVASIGTTLVLPNIGGSNKPIIDPSTFAALVTVVFITTVVAPPALKWAFAIKPPTLQSDSTVTLR